MNKDKAFNAFLLIGSFLLVMFEAVFSGLLVLIIINRSMGAYLGSFISIMDILAVGVSFVVVLLSTNGDFSLLFKSFQFKLLIVGWVLGVVTTYLFTLFQTSRSLAVPLVIASLVLLVWGITKYLHENKH